MPFQHAVPGTAAGNPVREVSYYAFAGINLTPTRISEPGRMAGADLHPLSRSTKVRSLMERVPACRWGSKRSASLSPRGRARGR